MPLPLPSRSFWRRAQSCAGNHRSQAHTQLAGSAGLPRAAQSAESAGSAGVTGPRPQPRRLLFTLLPLALFPMRKHSFIHTEGCDQQHTNRYPLAQIRGTFQNAHLNTGCSGSETQPGPGALRVLQLLNSSLFPAEEHPEEEEDGGETTLAPL